MNCHVNQRFSLNDSPLVSRSSVITRSESDEVIHKLCRIATDFSILKIFKSVYKNLKVFVIMKIVKGYSLRANTHPNLP